MLNIIGGPVVQWEQIVLSALISITAFLHGFLKIFQSRVVIPEISREKPATLSHLTFRPQGHLKKEVNGRGVHLCAVTPPLGTTLSPHIGATLVGKTVIVPIWLRPLQTRAGLIPEIATLSGKSCLKKTITALKTPI